MNKNLLHASSVRSRLSMLATLISVLMLSVGCTSTQKSSSVSLSQLREGFANPPKEA